MTPSPHPATPTLSDLSPEARGLLETQTIELPSWAFGNSGTRFRVFTTAGVPRDPFEKIDDVARVNAFTGITPRVSLHIPWDRTDDYEALRRTALAAGAAAFLISGSGSTMLAVCDGHPLAEHVAASVEGMVENHVDGLWVRVLSSSPAGVRVLREHP